MATAAFGSVLAYQLGYLNVAYCEKGKLHPMAEAAAAAHSAQIPRPPSPAASASDKKKETHDSSLAKTATAPVAVAPTHAVVTPVPAPIAAKAEGKEAEAEAETADDEPKITPGLFRPDLPTYSMDEVKKHKTPESRIWVVYEHGVYDITEFVEIHPGGSKRIMLAAGGSIAPFWKLYAQHKEQFVYQLLEQHRIGNLSEKDASQEKAKSANISDPYANEPERHPSLIVRSKQPFTAEPPLELLAESMITPTDLFYKRHHLPVPRIDLDTYKVEVNTSLHQDKKPKHELSLSLDDIKHKYPKHTVMAAIQCAGNRRDEMTAIKPVKGGKWDAGAISNATWSGALLSDVLAALPDIEILKKNMHNLHIEFVGLDQDPASATKYGASIPLEMALDPKNQVMLAYEMNGEQITLDHGFPIRAVVPGVVGARNVKWLCQINITGKESDSHWQQNDYKGFNPNVDWDTVDFSKSPAIQELPVNSVICVPPPGTKITTDDKEVEVKGYAWSGGGRGIVRVDVSGDGGKTWSEAELQTPDQPRNHVYGWTLWKAKVKVDASSGDAVELVCKAVDSSYNCQPESVSPIWNLRGVLNNAWHRVHINIA